MSYEAESARLRRLLEEVSTYLDSFDDESEDDHESDEDRESEMQNDFLEEFMGTETEQSYESYLSDDEVEQSQPHKKMRVTYFTGKDGTLWNKDCLETTTGKEQLSIHTHLPGAKSFAKHAKTALECWLLFFSDEILQIIVECTNCYIRKVSENYSRERSARCTDLIEMKALMGLLYLAGCHKNSHRNLKELWDQKRTGIERFWLTMSRERFLFLLKCLRFDDLHTSEEGRVDSLGPIQKLFDLFVKNCKKCYTIGEYATIYEKLEVFRGKCGFKQYISKKTDKHEEVALFAVIDAKTYYTLNLEVDLGKQPEDLNCSDTLINIVTRLITPISGTGRNITCSNRFTSFPLIKNLLEEHRLTYVGTVQKDKRELPAEFVNTKQRPIASSVFGFQKNITLVSYVPKKGKNVIVASSMHHDNLIDLSTVEKNKPEIITFYNSTKSSADTIDKMCVTYNVAQSTRWPMVIFYSLLNIAGINSQILNVSNNNDESKQDLHTYLNELAISLTEEQLKRRASLTNIAPEIRKRRQEAAGTSAKCVIADQFPPNTRKRCYMCKKERKTKHFCEICKKFICLQHVEFSCSGCQILSLSLLTDKLKWITSLTDDTSENRKGQQEIIRCETAEQLPSKTRRKCYVCKINRKTRYLCTICKKFICLSHAKFSCFNCQVRLKDNF